MRMKVNKLDDGSLEVIASQLCDSGETAYTRLVVSKGESSNLDTIAAASAACAIELAKEFPSKFLGATQVH